MLQYGLHKNTFHFRVYWKRRPSHPRLSVQASRIPGKAAQYGYSSDAGILRRIVFVALLEVY